MLKRKFVVQTFVAVVVLLTIGTNDLCAQINIDQIEIIFQKGFDDGVPESPLPWGLEIYADLSRATFLWAINVTRVGDLHHFGTLWPSTNPGHWEWVSPSLYETLSALRSVYTDATLQFDFLNNDGWLLHSVTVDISDLPGEPVNPVEFTYPFVNTQGVRPDSKFTWDVNRNDGDMLMMGISKENGSEPDLYFEAPVSMNTTSWKPGFLPVSYWLSLFVSVNNVKDWGNGNNAYPTISSGGDTFEYGLMVEYFNEMRIYVKAVDIVPDTITTRTRSITCHIWPPANLDVTDIRQNSLLLFDNPILINGIIIIQVNASR